MPRSVWIRRTPREFARLQVDGKSVLKTRNLIIDLTRLTRVEYNISVAFSKPFNRTSMESKPDWVHLESLAKHPFNRTSMESKLAISCFYHVRVLLLIEPVWNRNIVYVYIIHYL